MSRCHSRSDSTASHEPYHPCANLEHNSNRSLPLYICISRRHTMASGMHQHCIPSTSQGYHAMSRAQAWQARSAGWEKCCPGHRVVRLRQIDGMPHSPSAQGRSLGRHRAVGRREVMRNPENYREHSSWLTPLHYPVGAGGTVRGGRAGL